MGDRRPQAVEFFSRCHGYPQNTFTFVPEFSKNLIAFRAVGGDVEALWCQDGQPGGGPVRRGRWNRPCPSGRARTPRILPRRWCTNSAP